MGVDVENALDVFADGDDFFRVLKERIDHAGHARDILQRLGCGLGIESCSLTGAAGHVGGFLADRRRLGGLFSGGLSHRSTFQSRIAGVLGNLPELLQDVGTEGVLCDNAVLQSAIILLDFGQVVAQPVDGHRRVVELDVDVLALKLLVEREVVGTLVALRLCHVYPLCCCFTARPERASCTLRSWPSLRPRPRRRQSRHRTLRA